MLSGRTSLAVTLLIGALEVFITLAVNSTISPGFAFTGSVSEVWPSEMLRPSFWTVMENTLVGVGVGDGVGDITITVTGSSSVTGSLL